MRKLNKINDRSSARWGRRVREHGHGAGIAPPGESADRQHLQPGPGMRPGLLRQRCARHEDGLCAEE